jgi:heme-degrading monooxygenase HmoA
VILEVATLQIRPGQAEGFERSFRRAQSIISSMPGHISHELQRCVERPNEYVLLVRWQSVEAHEEGFRGSPEYQEWKALLHHYYDPFPRFCTTKTLTVLAASSQSGGTHGFDR